VFVRINLHQVSLFELEKPLQRSPPSGTLPNPISGHDFPISVYPDIEPDIGYDIADTRYRVFPDIGYPDIGTYPISGIPISGMSRYRESRYRDQYRDIPISGPNVTISGH
jgi:hypothetical protein